MTKKLQTVSVLGLTTLMMLAAASTTLAADRPSEDRERPSEIHQQIHEAIANNDYTTWASLMGEGPLADKISESLFEAFKEIDALRESDADHETIKAALDELQSDFDIELPQKRGMKKIKQAIIDGDYAAWSTLVADSPFAENASEEVFNALKNIEELKASGADKETVKAACQALETDFGIELPEKRPQEHGKHMRGEGRGEQ